MKIYNVRPQNNNANKKHTSFKGFQDITATIQGNTLINRCLLSVFGFNLPFALNANNKTERNERLLRSTWVIFVAFVSPLFLLPFFNKKFLLKEGLIKNGKDKAKQILFVSKDSLNENAEKMVRGINEKGKKLGLEKEFNNILENFKGKEEVLREKLINIHKNVFKWDFITTSVASTATPWIGNAFTKMRTGRNGYSGEFKMADETYTSKLSEKHEKNKYKKMVTSFGLAVLPTLFFPKYMAKAMLKDEKSLHKLGQWFKKNAGKFDYKNAMYMSISTYSLMWFTGDYPTYMFACRDKHELKYALASYTMAGLFFFFGDSALNSFIGKKLDKYLKTQMMDYTNYNNKSFLEKTLTPLKQMEEIDKLPGKIGKLTKKCALNMYWVNMGITALLLGYGVPKMLNKILKKNVEKDIKGEKKLQAKPLPLKLTLISKVQHSNSKIFKDFIK